MMTSFTVVKKGQEIEFNSHFVDLNDAREHLRRCASHNTFAMDLIVRKQLSEKQIAWVHYLATQDVIDSQTPATVGEYQSLVKKMYDAVKNNTRKLQVRLPGVTLSTVNQGVNVGCVYIYENQSYVGKITTLGELIGTVSEDVKNLLEDANDNLLQLAKIYGHETGNCSICGRTLSDPLSIQMGIGPVCAQRFE